MVDVTKDSVTAVVSEIVTTPGEVAAIKDRAAELSNNILKLNEVFKADHCGLDLHALEEGNDVQSWVEIVSLMVVLVDYLKACEADSLVKQVALAEALGAGFSRVRDSFITITD